LCSQYNTGVFEFPNLRSFFIILTEFLNQQTYSGKMEGRLRQPQPFFLCRFILFITCRTVRRRAPERGLPPPGRCGFFMRPRPLSPIWTARLKKPPLANP